LFALLV
ncbi:hypothetical protein Hypma_014194, partial [Hypsizygus marmoreus]